MWEVNRAADWPSFQAALRHFVGPIQNIVYADVDGTIGFIAPGLVPIRRNGQGWMPAPGWTGSYDWTGFIPFEELPSAVNPPSGHFVTANNKIVPDSYPYFLSRDWDLPNRAERIEALLAATPVQTPASSAAIQADTLSLMAQRLVPLMTGTVARNADDRGRPSSGCGTGTFAWIWTRSSRCCSPLGCANSAARSCSSGLAMRCRITGICGPGSWRRY